MCWETAATARFDARSGFDNKYCVKVTNSSGAACTVDLHVPSGDRWAMGDYGILLQQGETKYLAVRDWEWMAWGGPFRVLNHVQDQPMSLVVHRDNGESSDVYEVRPNAEVAVSEGNIIVSHNDTSDHWATFLESDNAQAGEYQFKYVVHLVNETEHQIAADVLVPSAQHGSGRTVGARGIKLPDSAAGGKSLSIVVPDHSWMGWGGPHRVTKHLQESAVEITLTTDQGKLAPYTARVTSGCTLTVQADGQVKVQVDGFSLQPASTSSASAAPPAAPAAAESGGESGGPPSLGTLSYFPLLAKGLAPALCAEASGLPWAGTIVTVTVTVSVSVSVTVTVGRPRSRIRRLGRAEGKRPMPFRPDATP
jgi:hypothetical protein